MGIENLHTIPVQERSEHISFEMPSGLSGQELAYKRQYARTVEKFLDNPKFFIDKGGAGEVFALGESGLCVKVVRNKHRSPDADQYDLGNTLPQEGTFLRRLTGMEIKGARVPAYIDILLGIERSALIMEQLPAVNAQKVLNGEESLPESFSLHPFFDALEAFVSHMHEQGIVHGDLYARNIMIDVASGMPYIIDFGRAKDAQKLPPEKRTEWENHDWARLEKIAEDFEDLTNTLKTV